MSLLAKIHALYESTKTTRYSQTHHIDSELEWLSDQGERQPRRWLICIDLEQVGRYHDRLEDNLRSQRIRFLSRGVTYSQMQSQIIPISMDVMIDGIFILTNELMVLLASRLMSPPSGSDWMHAWGDQGYSRSERFVVDSVVVSESIKNQEFTGRSSSVMMTPATTWSSRSIQCSSTNSIYYPSLTCELQFDHDGPHQCDLMSWR